MNKLYKEVQMNTVIHGSYDDVQKVFDKHTLVFDESYFDYELLIAALKRRNSKILNYFLYKLKCRVVNPNIIKPEETPLHLAMKLNKPFFIEKLLCEGTSPFDKDENGEIPILIGFKNERYEAVDSLLENYDFICKPNDEDFMLHFHIAGFRSNIRFVEDYLEHGICANSPLSMVLKPYCGSSLNLVQFAAENNYWQLFALLINYEGDLSIKNVKGETPLHNLYYNSSRIRIEIIKNEIAYTFACANDTKFVNAVDIHGLSHFHICCMLNEPDLIETFIDNGVDVNSAISLSNPINPGYTPLHFAVENGCEKVVEILLREGANCNKRDKDGRTPLHLVCKTSEPYRTEIVKLLLDHQASPFVSDEEGYLPLFMVFYHSDCDNQFIYKMLLAKITSDINFTVKEGLSLFHIACCANDLNLVKGFLAAGVNVNAQVSYGIFSGYTALHFAALYNQKDVVQLLLEKNALVNVIANDGFVTPLHLACEFNYAKFIGQYSLAQNSLAHRYEFQEYVPFPIDADSVYNHRNQLDIISLLLSHGANMNAIDGQGMTPLLHACMIDKNYCKLKWTCTSFLGTSKNGLAKEINIRIKEIIKTFISYKAKLNARSYRKESILHIISKYSVIKIRKNFIRSILHQGIDIDAVDEDGFTPLHAAVQANNKRMVRLLLKYNANVTIKCNNARTPLHLLLFTGQNNFENGSDEIDIFCALLEKGSDIHTPANRMTKKKYLHSRKEVTLLYHAMEMDNEFIVGKLLEYGADINMEDPSGYPCTYLLVNWAEYDFYNWAVPESLSVFKTIYIHVQKLLALNLPVSEKVKSHCDELQSFYTPWINLDNIFNDCIEELNKMKLVKINDTSLDRILLMKDQNKLAKYAKNKKLIKIITARNFTEDYPLYSNILKVQYTRGCMRRNLLPSTKKSIKYLFKASLPQLPWAVFPDLCWDVVLENLENKDCGNVINVVEFSSRQLKRKSSDTNLQESEHLRNVIKERKIEN